MSAPRLPDDALDDDLLRQIGRNLVLFQRIESNFKKLMGNNRITFPLVYGMSGKDALDSFEQAIQTRIDAKSKQTLGNLVGGYRSEVLTEREGDLPPPPHGGCTVSIGYQKTYFADGKSTETQRLARIVSERNALAHTLLDRLGSGTRETLDETRRWLDQQHQFASEFLLWIREELSLLGRSRLMLVEHLQQADLRAIFEQARLAQSPLAGHFAAEARRPKRNDGWANFTTAAQTAHASLPEEAARLEERYGHPTLRAAIEATGLFEFKEETTPRGGRRTLYRIKPELLTEPEAQGQAPDPLP